jgi:hypothetical protein
MHTTMEEPLSCEDEIIDDQALQESGIFEEIVEQDEYYDEETFHESLASLFEEVVEHEEIVDEEEYVLDNESVGAEDYIADIRASLLGIQKSRLAAQQEKTQEANIPPPSSFDESVVITEAPEEDEYEEQVIEKWFGRDSEPDDLHAACKALIAIVYKGEDMDAETMMRRTPLPELYRYLKQHFEYKVDTNQVKEDEPEVKQKSIQDIFAQSAPATRTAVEEKSAGVKKFANNQGISSPQEVQSEDEVEEIIVESDHSVQDEIADEDGAVDVKTTDEVISDCVEEVEHKETGRAKHTVEDPKEVIEESDHDEEILEESEHDEEVLEEAEVQSEDEVEKIIVESDHSKQDEIADEDGAADFKTTEEVIGDCIGEFEHTEREPSNHAVEETEGVPQEADRPEEVIEESAHYEEILEESEHDEEVLEEVEAAEEVLEEAASIEEEILEEIEDHVEVVEEEEVVVEVYDEEAVEEYEEEIIEGTRRLSF